MKVALYCIAVIVVVLVELVTATAAAAAAAAECVDNETWKHLFFEKVTCQWISRKEHRRRHYCTKSEIHSNCYQTCSACNETCEDDTRFRFRTLYTNKVKPCKWLSKRIARQTLYCQNDNWMKIRQNCPQTCQQCTTAIEVKELNVKRGIGAAVAHNCDIFINHKAVSWWYSWKAKAGFSRGFCSTPQTALDTARDDSNMEFVPMFHPTIPPQPFESEIVDNLQKATYLLTLNEPEREFSGNMTPYDAAVLWPKIVSVANDYNLSIVGPCTTNNKGMDWYIEWLSHCKDLHGEECEFDYSCFHFYYYPYPCNGVPEWACIGRRAQKLKWTVREWYNTFSQKQIWITEFGCNPGMPCGQEGNMELMKQVTPYLDSTDKVHRYAWFSANREPMNTNQIEWTVTPKQSCRNTRLLPQTSSIGDCQRQALDTDQCHSPMALTYFGKKNSQCRCSTDACTDTVDSELKIWYQDTTGQDSSILTSLGELYQII